MFNSSVSADTQTEPEQNQEALPHVWIYDVSGTEHSFMVTVRRELPQGMEVTLNKAVSLSARGERKFNVGFDDGSDRYSALVQVDGGKEHEIDVTTVAKHPGRYCLLVRTFEDREVAGGIIHQDPPAGGE